MGTEVLAVVAKCRTDKPDRHNIACGLLLYQLTLGLPKPGLILCPPDLEANLFLHLITALNGAGPVIVDTRARSDSDLFAHIDFHSFMY